VLGEGESMGPLNDRMKQELLKRQRDIRYAIEWTTLGEYLQYLERRGVSPNVASFIGAATPRIYVIGDDDRPPTADELKRMQDLVRQAMEEGAVGVASALVYPPGCFAKTDELIALAQVAAQHGGMYISHLRSEGTEIVESVEELLAIARAARIRAEIYHLKTAGRENWPKMSQVIAMVEKARSEGLPVTADVYTYPAGATGLNSTMPPWVQDGGFEASLRRMKDPATRKRIAHEMRESRTGWENMYLQAGSPDKILLVGFKSRKLKPLTGKTLAEIAKMRGTSPEETVMDLIVEDESSIATIYFTQSEENLRRKIALPWVSFCSDSPSLAPEGVFLKSSVHPRAYGSFARLLGRFVREEKLLTVQEAVRKLAALPAEIALGVLGGAFSAVLAYSLLSVVESAFGFVTGSKLLELTNSDLPIFRQMSEEAPGSYHHSLVVATLAEKAAEELGLDAPLAKAGALYHDIGKTKMPEYFIENRTREFDLHKDLTPSMSTLVIKNHVKEGVELARKLRLPRPLREIIEQHHGNSLVRFFYAKAKQLYDPEEQVVGEESFRYPGPPPQTKEAGLVMLADAIEAASRSLKSPTKDNLKRVITDIINGALQDGQLDACDFSMRELRIVAAAFLTILYAIYHPRIEYPGFGFNGRPPHKNGTNGAKKKDHDRDHQPPEKKPDPD